jgi:hypothetical protein
MATNGHRERLDDHDLSFLAGSCVVFHCHHFNLFFDQTIDDALGEAQGVAVRTAAACEAWHPLLSRRCAGASSPGERLELAANLFSAMGHGRMSFDVGADGGKVTGRTLHYAAGWREKYGRRGKRPYPVDAFAAGFAQAAVAVAHEVEHGHLGGGETNCAATGDDKCRFDVVAGGAPQPIEGKAVEAWKSALVPIVTGKHEETVQAITDGLVSFLSGVHGDNRGLVQAFGVLVTNHPADYYNHLSNRMLALTKRDKSQTVPVARDLLQESGQVCGFHTFGGIMSSPEWEALVGAPSEPLDVILGGLAIARALGFGRWSLADYVPNERLVVTSPGTYESMHNRVVIEHTEWPCSYLFQGGAVSMMQLAHRVMWTPKPTLTGSLYLRLRKDAPWRCEQTKCLARGDDVDQVVVTRV